MPQDSGGLFSGGVVVWLNDESQLDVQVNVAVSYTSSTDSASVNDDVSKIKVFLQKLNYPPMRSTTFTLSGQ